MAGTWRPWALAVALLGAAGCQGAFLAAGPAAAPASAANIFEVETQQLQSKVEELKSQTLAAAAQAGAAAADSRAAALRAQRVGLMSEVELARVKRAIPEATEQAAKAAELSKGATSVLQEAQAYASEQAVESAESLAVQAVQDFFTGRYQELEDWRKTVLQDPWEAGRQAAVAAAEPYEQAEADAMAKAKVFQDQASKLATAAKQELDAATKLSKAAALKQISGDVSGRNRNSELSLSLRKHSEELSTYAKKLKAEGEKMASQAPQLAEQARSSAWAAEQKENPEALPPLPFNPNLAYTPPPPQ